ncbi:hypothetical protein CALVIDRAFT_599234 [Calocera viscosa TUFC12733]|uniref:Uncharacterized protein n=1 Tax=Calocera viscosa (strain TUFC12733) TaxID=1330018 RepID=A0A167L911_CALVF|nr:hypothetical protein CALVIDRAFT_599234 [Calocera viscosa TUFC12733]
MPLPLTRLVLSRGVYDLYPDSDAPKPVRVYADRVGADAMITGERHVSLNWENAPAPPAHSSTDTAQKEDAEQVVLQFIQLSGGPGNYAHHTPSAQARPRSWVELTPFWELGTFSRAQRDDILALAKRVKYLRKSRTNSCQVWLRELLEAMMERGLVAEELVSKVEKEIPLKIRRPEEEETE